MDQLGGVQKERVESIAEHIYGTQMLAIAMWSEFDYKVDIMKVLGMLAIHELEETKIGDLTMFQIDRETKKGIGHKAIEEILEPMIKGKTIEDWILEFDERKTLESKFTYYCDKLEADIQCKLYDQEKCVDISKPLDNEAKDDERVKRVLKQEKSWSRAWVRFAQERYGYDNNFLKVSNYIKDNNI